ncbi:hypothetical protein IscW_ISCW013866 [Ixodes scapularis]|uniref:Uncharacterized protein n=1 Tax=Ixodes scapularis TaxID=6945 RepID=B7QJQ4_IXOSC|nr:hypothetical protein IscW_ISCW013866 [Ixodes scapularis]|eukprot:XP_002415411.1 hypothetical protein IscW_ISCW013866 [Ixodes scapularis]
MILCNKTAEEASSVRQLLLGAGTPSSASCASSPGSTSSADRGYGLPFCMDDDQLTDTCDTSLPEVSGFLSPSVFAAMSLRASSR